jgi:uncharacterized protein (TIGR02001 family)
MKTLHKTAISAAAVALLSGLACTSAFAEEAAAEAPEASPVTANVTVASSYIYRGITQTNNKPAIQGGFDYAHESGFYVGNWNSSISWISDGYNNSGNTNGPKNSAPSTSAPIEMDFYAGFKKEIIGEGFASDFGVLQYYYPTTGLGGIQPTSWVTANPSMRQTSGVNPSTTELYAAQNFTFGSVTGFAKFSYAVSNLFGIANSKGAYYPDLTVNYDTGFYGLTLNAHAGYQFVPNNVVSSAAQVTAAGNPANQAGTWNASYADWKLGVTKDFGGGLSGTAYYTATSAQKVGPYYVYSTPNGGNAGRANAVVALTKTF